MVKLTFYPLGNADTSLIDLENKKKLLLDFANVRGSSEEDKRCDLAAELRKDLSLVDRNDYDVVVFTHLDNDHVCGAADFFHLDHAAKYQGGERVKISTLWVPAAVIIENRNDLNDDAKTIQAEARYRFEQGYGIRVFSRPSQLKDWLEKKGIELQDRMHLISDAGTVVPEFSLSNDGVEFFVHSPFVSTINATGSVVRNDECLVLQATFCVEGTITQAFFAGDADWEVLKDIVTVTKDHHNETRLEWHIMHVSHHSSYTSLGPDKGVDETVPNESVRELLEIHGRLEATLVSPSWPIPIDDADTQPPHRQAAAYYRRIAKIKAGEYIVTMEHPTVGAPKPLIIEITKRGQTVKKSSASGAFVAVSSQAPRAG